ncbi:MAG: RNA polymerase sigma factor [Anaerolineae bacterium]
MESAQDIDRDALFEQLFAKYRQTLLNYLFRMLGDEASAEELTQETFVRAYQALPRLAQGSNHRAWLYRIATNLAYDHLRRARLIRWTTLQPWHSRGAAPGSDTRDVQQALGRLSPALRAPLVLYSVQGYSTAEIAELLGISEGAVKTRLCRAREKLRLILQEDGHEMSPIQVGNVPPATQG